MSGSLAEILRLVGAGSLLLTPGLMVLLALPAKLLPRRGLLSAAFVLSPAVLALELAVAALAGAPFSLFVPAATVTNAIAAALLAWLRPARIALEIPVAWIPPAVLVIAPVVVALAMEPLRRAYGWHNMMQLAAILDIFALPRPPEEIELADFRLNYGWLGWAQVAAIAKLTETSPTLVFAPLNIAHLALLLLFACEAAVLYRGGRHAMVGVATTLALLCTGLVDIMIRFVLWSYIPHGESRITPFHCKFLYMDLMNYAMSSLALMSYALARATQSRDMPAVWLMCISACAACLIYPLFLPSCVVIIGTFLSFALLAPQLSSWSFPRYRPMEVVAIGVAGAASLTVPAVYILFLGRDSAAAGAWLNLSRVPMRVAHLGLIFCLNDGLLLWIALLAWRDRAGATLLVVGIAAALQIAFVVIEMPLYVEYKFLFAALIVTAPALAAWLTVWAERDGVRRVVIGAIFAIAATGSALALTSWGWHDPPGYAEAVPLDEAAAEPHPMVDWSESWQRAVRDRTPADAVLLTGASNQADAVFVTRALYVCNSENRHGYSMSCQQELQVVKRYPPAEIARRKAVLNSALAADLMDADAAALMDALVPLARPIILHTRSPSAFRTWLETNGVGKSIFASDTDNVWLIDRGASSPASR
jgi:hypothetical protein